ncbi:MAG: hypothetical protein HZA32_16045 [Opitutae bacterium]|nr:hypothetical protein [Opitutae bacterium]
METVTLYRPVGQKELDLIQAANFRVFPPRLAWQSIFYPVLSEDYAIQIARDWNTRDSANGNVGYVTAFEVEAAYCSKFERKCVGRSDQQELWVPAEELAEFNARIVGAIRVVREFRAGD